MTLFLHIYDESCVTQLLQQFCMVFPTVLWIVLCT